MDGQSAERSRPRFSREGDGVSRRHGRSRTVWQTMPAMWHAGATHRARRARGELLPDMSDGREAAGRPVALEAAQGRLAAHARQAGAPASETRPVWLILGQRIGADLDGL